MNVKYNLVGKKFGRLLIIKYSHNDNNGARVWECRCDCGNIINVTTSNLNSGSTISCGCYKKEHLINKNSKANRYVLYGDYIIGYTNKGEEFYIDTEDYEKIKPYYWSMMKGYLRATKKSGDRKISIYLHSLVLDLDDSTLIDHIDGNKIDCRKQNLRKATVAQNAWNSKRIIKSNTSGYKGVYEDKRNNKWYARITINKKLHHLGYYSNLNDAINARRKAELEFQKEYRRPED